MAECDGLVESHNKVMDAYNSSTSSIKDQELGTLALTQRLGELASQNTQTTASYTEMKAIIDQLNADVPGLGLTYDGVTESVDATVEAIKKAAKAQADSEYKAEQQQTYVDLLKEQSSLEQQIAEAEANLDAERQRRGMRQDDVTGDWVSGSGLWMEDSPWVAWTSDIDDYKKSLEELQAAYTTNDPAKLVYVETPEFYYFDGIDGDYEVMAVSTYPVPGFEFMPRTYSAAYLVAMEGETDSKKPTSRSGVFSDYNSLNGLATDIKKLGSQYTGMLAVDNYIDGLLMMIEFGTKDTQTVIMGACSLPYDNNHVALAAETGVNRILLTKAQAAGYVVGQTVSLDSNNYYSENVAKNRIITKIEDKSTDQTYIYFDGAAVNIPEGCHIGSRPWVNGAADVVAASSGSTVDNTSGKYPFI